MSEQELIEEAIRRGFNRDGVEYTPIDCKDDEIWVKTKFDHFELHSGSLHLYGSGYDKQDNRYYESGHNRIYKGGKWSKITYLPEIKEKEISYNLF